MCVLVNGELHCTDFNDSDAVIYESLNECERNAEYRFYGLTAVFSQYDQPYERIEMGCKQSED